MINHKCTLFVPITTPLSFSSGVCIFTVYFIIHFKLHFFPESIAVVIIGKYVRMFMCVKVHMCVCVRMCTYVRRYACEGT